ncbi:MAG: hypothetical protein KME42_01825 [Tildeniella nuda ZEHNDER 1965/U140]|jgi:dihydroneopterin aldolase|nr:hypothetical protein [Tildeniella nuda ZEHNDER 1965/U140]
MTNLLTEAFRKAQDLPEHLQDELAEQLIDDIENEWKWQKQLAQPQSPLLDALAEQALSNSLQGKTQLKGFDEL